MAKKNTVEVTYKLNEDGTLSEVGKQADKTAKSTEKLGKSNAKAVKGMKGVGQAGLSASKGFSKMRNSMGDGGSGLVAAYATLAANVFALTAAFSALSGAFQAETLISSVNFLGNEIGRNLDSTVQKLQDVTDGALSMEAALRGAALGTSAGFSTDQITGLAEVARGASLALGRDMGDAFDRLIRGTAKLEPEILDELGIIVRLDSAYEAYALALGKTATQLTVAEKSQAFINATLAEGTDKFGDLGKAMKTNPYDKLMATLINMKNSFVGWMNETLKFGDIALFLSDNIAALAGVLGVFASTIASKLLPALYGGAAAMHANAVAAQQMAVAQLSGLRATNQGAKGWNNFLGGLQDGTKSLGDAEEGHKSLNRSIGQHQGQLSRLEKMTGDNTVAINLQKKAIAELNLEKKKLYLAQQLGMQASAKEAAANAIHLLSTFQLRAGFTAMGVAIAEYKLGLVGAGVQTTGFIGLLNALKVAAFSTGLALKAAGSMALAAFGWISAVASILYMIFELTKDYFFPPDLVQERIDGVLTEIGKLSQIQDQYGASLKTGSSLEMAGYKMVAGAMQQQVDNISNMMNIKRQAREDDRKTAGEAVKSATAARNKAMEDQKAALDAMNAATKYSKVYFAHKEALKKANAAYDIADPALASATAANTAANTPAAKAADIAEVAKVGVKGIDDTIKGMSTGLLAELFKPVIADLEALKTLSPDGIVEGLIEIQNKGAAAEGFIKGLGSSVDELKKAQNKFGAKASTPYDDILKSAEGVQKQFDQLKGAGKILEDGIIKNLDALVKTDISDLFGDPKNIDDFVKNLRDSLKTIREYAAVQKVNKQAQSLIASTTKSSLESLKKQHSLEQDMVKNKKDLYNAQVTANAAAFAGKTAIDAATGKFLNEEYAAAFANNELLRAEYELEEKLYDTTVNGVKVDILDNELKKEALGILNKLTDAQAKNLDLRKQHMQVDAEINALAEYRSGKRSDPVVTANELYILHKKTESESLALLEVQRSSAIAMADLDSTMVQLKFKLIMEQLRVQKLLTADEETRLTGYITTLNTALEITKENINLEFDLRKKKIELEGEQLRNNAIQSIITGAGTGESTIERSENMTAALRGTGQDAVAQVGKLGEEGYVAGQDKVDPVGFGDLKLTEQITASAGLLDPMIEKLKTLGPEGELVAAMSAGTLSMVDAFATMAENIDNKADPTIEKLKMAGAAIGAISSMVAAASKSKIAGIDQEIAAEEKRDGKSAASVAKIKALEKKKEAAKKKAFEVNKKLSMAETVINTAAAVMYHMKESWPLALAVGILGAAQLAVIAGTSYQGGGAAAEVSKPSSLSMGERSNTVDLGKGNNAGGELAYMRGESGTGTGASNFKPTGAFTGAKYRGSGGYIVGEQGPELFVPQESGEVISAGNTAGIGGSTNVSFNIQAIDASGVEDVLIAQKGQIIRMIREAANEHGEFFLENVREEAYQK